MEVKLGQSQALTNMNSQNIELQRANMQNMQKVKEQSQMVNQDKVNGQGLKLDARELSGIVNDLNRKLDMLNSQLRIEVDDETGIQIVKIVDKETKEVIRQIPPEAVLKVAKYLNEITGLLFDSKA